MSRKRGQLSLEEQQYIKDNFNTSTIEEIAEFLNRNPAPVKRYINDNHLMVPDDPDDDTDYLKHKLHKKTFWSEIERQFDKDSGELEYFENALKLFNSANEKGLPNIFYNSKTNRCLIPVDKDLNFINS